MRPTTTARLLRDLWTVSSTASRAYDVGRIDSARLALRLRRRNGLDVGEALREGLLDPRMDDERRFAWIGRALRRPAQDRLNPPSLEPFTEQKILFYDYCAALGIPVPQLYGAVGHAGGWNRISGRAITDEDSFAAFVDALPGDVVIKPAFGYMGLGIRVLSRVEGRLVDSEGGDVSSAALFGELRADPTFDLHLVQERLRNHPAVEEIAGSPVLQTVRVNTIIRPDGSALVFGAVLKLATGTGDADNYHAGATGNGYCEISLEDGRLGDLIVPGARGAGRQPSATVPGTDRSVRGRRIPFSAEVVEIVRRAAPGFLPMRTLGWDVAITPGGPAVIEANNWWAPFTPLPPEAWRLMMEEAE